MAETRHRITTAAVELHEQVGPLATSVAAIAERAGVGRPTVYAHFPDEQTLFEACTTHYFEVHPPPDLDAWAGMADPRQRLVRGLTDLYRYWRDIEPMASAVLRDQRAAPDRVGAGFTGFMDRCGEILAEGWSIDIASGETLRAAIALAVRFETWRLLVVERALAERAAVDLMVGTVAFAAVPTARPSGADGDV